jgi:hypothetical protein
MLISINLIMEQMEQLEEQKDELTSSEYLEECNRLKLLFDYVKNVNKNNWELIPNNNSNIDIVNNNYINSLIE